MSRYECGSGLVEHVVALALLGLLAVSLIGLLLAGSLAARSARDHSTAAWLAAQQLEQITGGRGTPASVSRSRLDPNRFPGYQWEATVAEGPPGLARVAVTVSWLHRGRERHVTLTTLVRSLWHDDHEATGSN
jgi:type II secretory pathway pseudopilin PulG